MESALASDLAKKHYQWRKRVNAHLPTLAARVFALRDKSYMGCGFHYGLEKQLGSLIAWVNDYDNPLTFSTRIRDELGLGFLLRGLLRAEFSSKGMDFPDRQKKAA
jgi:hypothetical protein